MGVDILVEFKLYSFFATYSKNFRIILIIVCVKTFSPGSVGLFIMNIIFWGKINLQVSL